MKISQLRVDQDTKIISTKNMGLVTLGCPMDFNHYPHDTQTCTFQIFEDENDNKTLILVDNTTAILQVSTLNKYNLEIAKMQSNEYSRFLIKRGKSLIGYKLTLQRKAQMYFASAYLPSTIFVIVSWIR